MAVMQLSVLTMAGSALAKQARMLNQRLVATATDRMYNPANEALGTYEVRE
jgi:hypothetical protein